MRKTLRLRTHTSFPVIAWASELITGFIVCWAAQTKAVPSRTENGRKETILVKRSMSRVLRPEEGKWKQWKLLLLCSDVVYIYWPRSKFHLPGETAWLTDRKSRFDDYGYGHCRVLWEAIKSEPPSATMRITAYYIACRASLVQASGLIAPMFSQLCIVISLWSIKRSTWPLQTADSVVMKYNGTGDTDLR